MMLTDLIKELKSIYKVRGELAIRPDVTAESLLATAAAPARPEPPDYLAGAEAPDEADQIGPVATLSEQG